jgi:hypothetical protein
MDSVTAWCKSHVQSQTMGSFWNPFSAYCVACLFVVLVYSLGFSDLYPDLSASMLVFLFFSVITAALLSWSVAGLPLHPVSASFQFGKNWLLAGIFLAGFAAEFAYFGGIPLLQGVSGVGVDYVSFGIPTFHVFLIGTSSFYAVYWWDCYLISKDRRFLAISSIAVLASLLMLSRGGVLIHLVAFAFAYGNRRGFRRKALLGTLLGIGIILGFGYLGEVRMGSRAEEFILKVGGANDKFLNSKLPDSTFWFYLYASSPLANFQYSELHKTTDATQWIGVVVDGLPDFISKYFITQDEVEAIAPLRITNELTVGTAYARPILTLGWPGPYALHILFLAFGYCTIRLSRNSDCYSAILALLCAQGSLMFFDNMLTFSGSLTPILVGLAIIFVQRLGLREGA